METKSSIPILPAAEAILDKYTDDPYCVANSKILPMSNNQKMNAYLKEVDRRLSDDMIILKNKLSKDIAQKVANIV